MQLRSAIFRKAFGGMRRIRSRRYKIWLTLAPMAAGFSILILCANGFTVQESGTVYAVKDSAQTIENSDSQNEQETSLLAGLMGVVNSVNVMEDYTAAAETVDFEHSHENILVGSSSVCKNTLNRLRVEQGTEKISEIGYYAQKTVRDNHMATEDYYALLQIVEAEATGGDMKSKILIANVVLNRVKDSRFPDTIYEVVWEKDGGVAQFQPTVDGRINSVTITEETIEAVDRALSGEDYSQGALCFMARESADQHNIDWFDENLVPLFEYGGHEYFTFAE